MSHIQAKIAANAVYRKLRPGVCWKQMQRQIQGQTDTTNVNVEFKVADSNVREYAFHIFSHFKKRDFLRVFEMTCQKVAKSR